MAGKTPVPMGIREATAPTVFAKKAPVDNFKERTKPEPIRKACETPQQDKTVELNKKLLAAAEKGAIRAVWDLLDEGADVNARDLFNRTPLILAAGGGHSETVELLLIKGADVDAADKMGTTALIQAAVYGYCSCWFAKKYPEYANYNPVSLDKTIYTIIPLLEKRADIGAVNELGHGPIRYLKMLMRKNRNLAKILQEGVWYGGKLARFIPANSPSGQEMPVNERSRGVD
ncbi:ankyrin repeat domain-containing protein [Candidatus Micrarchaeota archaeon]|nr:ankyrin repeat domain-containing protein [Candidatus Micrarchaeota archaeon]